MSLLRKASIVTTPTAYENGKILSVKPSIVLGEELVTNGNFATDSDWTKLQGTTISGGFANINSTNSYNTILSQTLDVIEFGKTYKIKFSIGGTPSDFKVGLGGIFQGSFSDVITSSGDYEINITKTNAAAPSNITFITWSTAIQTFTIDNVSVKEVLDADFDFTRNSSATRVNSQGLIEDMQILSGDLVSNGDFSQEGSEKITNGGFDTDSDWNIGSGWSISGSSLNGVAATGLVFQNFSGVVVGKTYKAAITVGSYTSGTISFKVGNDSYQSISSTLGIQEFYFTASTTGGLVLLANSAYTGSIDNVSVKEVGQDWTLGGSGSNTATIGSNSATITSVDGNSYLQQNSVLTSGKSYKISYEILSSSGSSVLKMISSLGLATVPTTLGTHTVYGTAISTDFYIERAVNSINATITNISVIEITDDTNLPRIDYTGGEGHWLFEPQSTNLLTYSEDFSQWPVVNSTILLNNIISPDETLNAARITATSTGDAAFVRNTQATQATSTTYSFSCFVKKGTTNFVRLANRAIGSATTASAWFDIENGVVGTLGSGLSSSKIEDFGNGWYRCIVIGTTGGTIANQLIDIAASTSNATLGVSANDYIFYWGAMFEQNSFSTSYIPTEGSIKTRLADAANGAGSSDLINSTEGVLYAEISALANDGTYRQILLHDNAYNNRIALRYMPTSNQINVYLNNGPVQVTFNYTLTNALDFNKIAFSFKENDFSLWVNGVEVATDTSGTTFSANTLQKIDFDFTNNYFFYGKAKCVAVFKEALNNDELECLTGEGYDSFNALALANNYTII